MSEKEIAKAQLIELLKTAKSEGAAKAAISIMFPRVKDLLQEDMIETGETSEAASGRRIGNGDFARQYFLLTPKTVVWSKSQAKELMDGDPAVAFSVFESRMNSVSAEDKPKLRRVILELLEERMRSDADTRLGWFLELMNNAALLFGDESWKSAGLFAPSTEDQVRIMLRQVLAALSQTERVELLRATVNRASDVSLLCELMRSVTGDTEPEGTDYKPDTLGDATEELRNLLLARVLSLAADGGLLQQIRPAYILWYWWGCGEGEQVRSYTEQLLSTGAGVRTLMEISISYVRSSEGNYERVNRQTWKKLVDLSQLEEHARTWSEAEKPDDRRLARRFLEAMRRDERM
jgi:hypothetical protein